MTPPGLPRPARLVRDRAELPPRPKPRPLQSLSGCCESTFPGSDVAVGSLLHVVNVVIDGVHENVRPIPSSCRVIIVFPDARHVRVFPFVCCIERVGNVFDRSPPSASLIVTRTLKRVDVAAVLTGTVTPVTRVEVVAKIARGYHLRCARWLQFVYGRELDFRLDSLTGFVVRIVTLLSGAARLGLLGVVNVRMLLDLVDLCGY